MSMNEKTTVPIPSVSADVGQPLANNFNTSIAETSAKCNASNSLKTVSMTELYDTVYPVAVPVIDNLLYSGTYLFVGAPKVGKSFFMAQVGYHVSNGLPLWGNAVHQGTVLYLALEDDYGRLQKRLSRMFGTDGTDLLHFAIQAKQLNCGLEGQLDEFVRLHPDTRLIIIDTLQKVRELGGEGFSYGSDYEIVTKLKKFSDQRRVCVMVVSVFWGAGVALKISTHRHATAVLASRRTQSPSESAGTFDTQCRKCCCVTFVESNKAPAADATDRTTKGA